jgi:hypothetical protein
MTEFAEKWEPMRLFLVKRLVLAGAVSLSVALGAAGVLIVDEIDSVFAQADEFELDGVVEAMPPEGVIGVWQVSGRAVTVTETTEIDQEMGTLAVGTAIEVEGTEQPDGSILASEIEVEDE